MTKVKFCGLRRPTDVSAARDLGADYAGFILSEGFKRTIGLGTFCELKGYLTGSETKIVGVFVDEPLEGILDIYAGMLDMIQLHGSEDEDYIRTLKMRTDKPVIKAFKIESEEDVRRACESSADYILLDSGTGTGKTFDHSLIKDIDRPYFLAGGLTPDNVREAVDTLHPFAVDASSGIESNSKKDKTKMADFIAAVRREG